MRIGYAFIFWLLALSLLAMPGSGSHQDEYGGQGVLIHITTPEIPQIAREDPSTKQLTGSVILTGTILKATGEIEVDSGSETNYCPFAQTLAPTLRSAGNEILTVPFAWQVEDATGDPTEYPCQIRITYSEVVGGQRVDQFSVLEYIEPNYVAYEAHQATIWREWVSTYVPALFWIAVGIFTLRIHAYFPATVAAIGAIGTQLPAAAWTDEALVLGMLVAVWLHHWSNKIWDVKHLDN